MAYTKRAYTKETIIERLDKKLKAQKGQHNSNPIYADSMVNYGGKTNGKTNEWYSEVISEYLLKEKNLKIFIDGIEPLEHGRKRKGYWVESHKQWTGNWEKEKRQEERLAQTMYGETYDNIGTVLDYQVPLKDYKGGRKEDSDVPENPDEKVRAGKIDLVSYNSDKNEIYLLELKRPTNQETLLRAALEIYTYSIQMKNQREKFKTDFKESKDGKIVNAKIMNAEIIPAVLVARNECQHKHCDLQNTMALIKKLGVAVFVYDATPYKMTAVTQIAEGKGEK
ncbi:MAG: hypothetical protein K2M34_03855 [Alphaproteobacteria bacterium]|nr:hypothetical protein [Alphaproteobacteria bacterium]